MIVPHVSLLLIGALPPPLVGRQILSGTVSVGPAVTLVAVLALYLWGVGRNNRLHPRHRWPATRTAAFVAGLAVTALAIFSFVGVYDRVLFWDHMIQHLLLIMVAGALYAVGSPLQLAWRATEGGLHRWASRALRSPWARIGGHPAVAYVVYAIVIPLTHLTAFYNHTLTSWTVQELEHVIYVVVGYLFWRQIFGSDPNCYRLHPAMKALFLFLAVPIDTFVGLSLDNETHEIFPAYVAMHRTWGPSLVGDLHVGGVIMWVGGDVLMMLALIPVVTQWVRLEERRAERIDLELDALFPERVTVHAEDVTPSWPEELSTAETAAGATEGGTTSSPVARHPAALFPKEGPAGTWRDDGD